MTTSAIDRVKDEASYPNRVVPVAEGWPEERGNKRSRLVRWVTTSGLALMDQGFISGSNFMIGIVLARWLTPDAYGSYALAFSVLLLLLLVYQSLLLEPMTVFGASSYRRSLRAYFKRLLAMHVTVAAAIVAVLGAFAVIVRYRAPSGPLPGALVGVTIAAPCILLFWLVRRVFYLGLSLVPAASAAGLYFTILISGMYAAYRFHRLSPLSAFLVMGLGALITSLLLLVCLKRQLASGETVSGSRELWRRHWEYGRWALASCIAGWVPTYIYYPLLSSSSGMASVGELRALTNLALPLFQTYTALSMVFLPHIARIRADKGSEQAMAFTRNVTMIFVSGAILYWALVLPFRTVVFHLLYSGKYSEVGYLVPLVALESVLWCATCGPATALRGIESPASVFWARCASSAVSVVVGIAVTLTYGIHGALWAMAASSGATLVVAFILLRKKVAKTVGTGCAIAECTPIQ